MSAPITIGGLLGVGGSGPNTLASQWEFDATECDKVFVMASCPSGATLGLQTTETISIYIRQADGGTIGGGPVGTVPVYTAAGAAAQLTASVQSMLLEGGPVYVFAKSATAAPVGCNIAIKRAQGA